MVGNDILRGGKKIGWLRGNDIYDWNGKKLGYYHDSIGDVFSASGRKIAYLRGNYLETSDGYTKVRLDEVHREVSGGGISEIARAAIRILLGD